MSEKGNSSVDLSSALQSEESKECLRRKHESRREGDHLWVMVDPTVRFPFGFESRMVSDGEGANELQPGEARQRPWPENVRPKDALPASKLREWVRENRV